MVSSVKVFRCKVYSIYSHLSKNEFHFYKLNVRRRAVQIDWFSARRGHSCRQLQLSTTSNLVAKPNPGQKSCTVQVLVQWFSFLGQLRGEVPASALSSCHRVEKVIIFDLWQVRQPLGLASRLISFRFFFCSPLYFFFFSSLGEAGKTAFKASSLYRRGSQQKSPSRPKKPGPHIICEWCQRMHKTWPVQKKKINK